MDAAAEPPWALTGATGTLGQALLPAMLNAGWRVRLLHRPGRPPRFGGAEALRAHPQLQCLPADGADAAALRQALEGVQGVVHAAARQSGSLAEQLAVAQGGTEQLLQAMRQAGVKRLVGVSSLAVYDYRALPAGSVLDEDSPLVTRPERRDPYTQAKLAQDALFRRAAHEGMAVVVLRPGVFYGEAPPWPFMLGKALGPRLWLSLGPQTAAHRLPMVHVADVASAITHACLRLSRETPAGQPALVLNLVEDPAPSAPEVWAVLGRQAHAPWRLRLPWALHWGVARALQQLAGRHVLRLPSLLRPDALAARFCTLAFSAARAREALGWVPAHRYVQALARSRPPAADA